MAFNNEKTCGLPWLVGVITRTVWGLFGATCQYFCKDSWSTRYIYSPGSWSRNYQTKAGNWPTSSWLARSTPILAVLSKSKLGSTTLCLSSSLFYTIWSDVVPVPGPTGNVVSTTLVTKGGKSSAICSTSYAYSYTVVLRNSSSGLSSIDTGRRQFRVSMNL